MEYKMFGPGGSPDESFRRGLIVLLGLDNDDWEAIEKWFLTTASFDSEAALSSDAFSNSSMTPERATESIEVVKFMLEAWHIHDLELPAIERDFMVLGRTPEEIERLGALLRRLEPIKEKAWASYMRSENENAVLPTLEDIDMVCDMRPIFEDYVFPPPHTETGRHKKLLGFTYVILAELQTEDSGGRKQRLVFQMTKERLTELEATVRRAKDQLAIPKARTDGLSLQS